MRRDKSRLTRIRADFLLLLVAVIWGTSFMAQKKAIETMGPISFVGARFLLAWIVLAPLAFYERRQGGRADLNTGDVKLAGVIGLCLFLGATLQQIGLMATTATNGGFLTALYVIFVPLIVWTINGARPRLVVFVAAFVSIAGAWMLTENSRLPRWVSGDRYILLADVAWAAAISLVPVFLARADRPFFLACAQYGVAAVFGLVGGLSFESFSLAGLSPALPAIFYAGVVSGGIAYTLQIFAQKHTPAPEAALIMSLESIFAALAGALFLSERLTSAAAFGCALILLGVVCVETGPALQDFGRRSNRRNPR